MFLSFGEEENVLNTKKKKKEKNSAFGKRTMSSDNDHVGIPWKGGNLSAHKSAFAKLRQR